MKAKHISRAAAAIVLSLTLGACQGAPVAGSHSSTAAYSSGKRSALVAQTEDYRRTIIEGVTAGALIGGIGAALITVAAGGDGRAAARNGLIGAALGGLAGGAVGKNVADEKQRYVKAEDTLQAKISQARANNGKLSKMVASANALVAQRQAEVRGLNNATAAEKRALASAIGSDKAAISSAISAADREISQMEALKRRFGGNSALNGEIGAAKAKRTQLGKNRTKLTSLGEKL